MPIMLSVVMLRVVAPTQAMYTLDNKKLSDVIEVPPLLKGNLKNFLRPS